ncbi:hypothetical protein SAMN05421823_101516 [Catalinimonas alkaloidigena]|uniref:Uncharacterized protein n=1 Tax=Catalinimonas alkaloidigena TaxID=1075417 RepID=A0A1G8Y0U7_9BACT|nr:hypothetical protein SAMN05421823_101516 [Catalinimonas alkaloidigena]
MVGIRSDGPKQATKLTKFVLLSKYSSAQEAFFYELFSVTVLYFLDLESLILRAEIVWV